MQKSPCVNALSAGSLQACGRRLAGAGMRACRVFSAACATLVLVFAFGVGLRVAAAEPRLVVTQVGLHFICTGDGQPDMYSWRIPIKDRSPGAASNAYRIPLEGEQDEGLDAYVDYFADSNTIPNVSGGRTALEVDETLANQFAVAPKLLDELNIDEFDITNLAAVNWESNVAGAIKSRFYSNYPPLNNYRNGGLYNTSTRAGDDPMRKPVNHPGYNPENWNHTLEEDTPLAVNQKRVQALLQLEIVCPVGFDADQEFKFVISSRDISSIEVNGRAVFATTEDVVFHVTIPSTGVFGVEELGDFDSFRRLAENRRVRAFGRMPEDIGYDTNASSSWRSKLLNIDLVSGFFTVNREQPMQFNSGRVSVKVYGMHDWPGAEPMQTIQFILRGGQVPSPDLVTVGSCKIEFNNNDGSIYYHPPLQAPRWWGLHRDGILGRFNGVAPRESLRGRLNAFYPAGPKIGGGVDNETWAVNNSPGAGWDPLYPGHLRQSVPGARALLYHKDQGAYIGVRQVDATMAADRRRYGPRPGDADSSWNRPWHFGTDSLRTLANTNRLVPKTLVTVDDWITPPGYDSAEIPMAYGLGFDEPMVTLHPTGQAVTLGEDVIFTAEAASTSAVTWQWRRNGQELEGATQNTLVLSPVSGFDAGDYEVRVTNAAGTVTSDPAQLTVESPVILAQPESLVAYAGLPAQLSVAAEGTGTVTYQWLRNGVAIPGATASSLIFSPVAFRDQGQYEVLISDAVHVVASEMALLQVVSPAPQVTLSPAGRVEAVLAGNVTFTAEVAGPGTPENCTWQWRRNGVNLAKAKSPSLTLSNLQFSQAGVYDVVVKNSYGTALSNPVELVFSEVDRPVGPLDVETSLGGEATLTVTLAGAVAYQWLKDGKPVKGAISSSLAITNAGFESAGVYRVVVTTPAGKFTTAGAMVVVVDPGLLVYKLAGSGVSYEGAASRRSAFAGWLVLDRVGQRGGFLFTGANGKQKIHWTEIRESLNTRSTGPVPGSLTVVSELVEDEVALWLSGTDSLIALSKTTRTLAPKTLSGIAHSWHDGVPMRVEMTSPKLVIDTAQTEAVRRQGETVEQALARLSSEMQARGSAVVGED